MESVVFIRDFRCRLRFQVSIIIELISSRDLSDCCLSSSTEFIVAQSDKIADVIREVVYE